MARKIVSEAFWLTTANATAKTDAQCENFAIRYTFAPIWTYQVPVNNILLLKSSHHFYLHLEDDESTSAEWGDPQQVRLSVWDADLRKMQIIYQGRYVASKEMQDVEKMAVLDLIPAGQELKLEEGAWIYIEGMCDNGTTALYTIDVSDSHFSIETERVKPSLF